MDNNYTNRHAQSAKQGDSHIDANALEQLLSRYLDGMTTLEEEERLASYFRAAHDLPDRLKPFRDMFAYFDEAMPIGEVPGFDGVQKEGVPHVVAIQKPRHLRLWTTLSIAAAAAMLLLVVRPWREAANDDVPLAPATVAFRTIGVTEPADTTKAAEPADKDSKRPATGDKRIPRHHYDMAPPKVYYAGALPDARTDGNVIVVHNDTDMAADNRRFLAEQKAIAEEQQQLQKEIEEMKDIANECKQNFVASGDFVDDAD